MAHLCQCRVCSRHREFTRQIEILNDAGLEESAKYFLEQYAYLNNLELDHDVNKAIIDGSWPTADEIIEEARARNG